MAPEETNTPETAKEEIKIHFYKSEILPVKNRTRFYQNFNQGNTECYFDLDNAVSREIVTNDAAATSENPHTLVLDMKDHGYSGKFQVMAFASESEEGTLFHPPTTMIRIQFGNARKDLVGRIFDNSIFTRLDY